MGFGSATTEDIIKASIGGLIISLSSSLNLYLKGQITGMSGTLNGIINGDKDQKPQKICLLMGMIITSSIFYLIQKEGDYFETVQQFETGLTIPGFIIAGYLTGLGAKLQNGCTSGHGVCGLPRFSIRSFVAVCTFMATALGTSSLLYSSVFNKYNYNSYNMFQMFKTEGDTLQIIETSLILAACVLLVAIVFYMNKAFKIKIGNNLVGLLTGILFALGLIISGMVKRHVVLGFLTIGSGWNPSLMFVLGCAVAPNLLTFYLMQKKTKKPLLAEKYCIPTNKKIDLKLISGGILFGMGWGIAGMCPGPVFCLIPTFYSEIIILFLPALVLGLQSEVLFKKFKDKYIKKSNNDTVFEANDIQEPLKN